MYQLIILIGVLIPVSLGHGHHHGNKAVGHHGSHGKGYKGAMCHGSGEVSDQFIQSTIQAISNPQSTTALIQFLTCLNSPDGQAAVKAIGVDPSVIGQLLKLLQGSPSDIATARTQIQAMAQSFTGSRYKQKYSQVCKIFSVYARCQIQSQAQDQIKAITADQLKTVLTALVAAENIRGFKKIYFADLLTTVNTKGDQGVQDVKAKLVVWIGVASNDDLNRAGTIASKALGKQLPPLSTVVPTPEQTSSRPPTTVNSVPANPQPFKVKPNKP